MDKISIERVEEDEEEEEERRGVKEWSEKDLEGMRGMCFWMGKEVEELKKESGEIKGRVLREPSQLGLLLHPRSILLGESLDKLHKAELAQKDSSVVCIGLTRAFPSIKSWWHVTEASDSVSPPHA
ncbi:uncharacterized protein A4U43_C04F17100 [Asparagus officinalis]|uniref:Uncharacterized protein n=1 Tax=Asparagus officinalis TaxID=4686 RepID=A0A5P1F6C4_ASPOF|nr:uncharacterized protein A4U43_C04F17100 [Asparagus officinalis]